MEQHTVVITGGAGFVGQALVKLMLQNGWRVVVYDRLAHNNASSLPLADSNLILVVADLLNQDQLSAVMETYLPECVIHLAAIHYIPYCNNHVVETLQTNVTGTAAVLGACEISTPRRFVLASTGAVYPPQNEALKESVPAAPLDIYGYSKYFAEQLVVHYGRQTGMECIIARLFNVFGPRETNPHLIPELVQQTLTGATEVRLGNLQPKRDYVFVEDAAYVLSKLSTLSVAAQDTPLVVNIATGKEYSVADVVCEFQAATDTSFNVVQDPDKLRPSDRLHLCGDVSLLRSMLGWTPGTDLRTGLQTTFEHAQQEQCSSDRSEH